MLTLTTASLIQSGDASESASGLRTLIEDSKCNVLVMNDRHVTPAMSGAYLKVVADMPPIAILGAHTLSDQMDANRVNKMLTKDGHRRG